MLRIRIRGLFDPWIRDPGSGIGFFRIPDPGSQTHIFESLVTIFWEKSKNFVKFKATKKGMTTNFFTPLFCSCFWIRDPRSGIGKNQDPG